MEGKPVTIRVTKILLVIAALVALAAPSVASADKVLQAVAVQVKAGKIDDYVGRVSKANGIMARLGIDATMRMWEATLAGDASGTVVVGIEYASLSAYADGTTKMQGDSEWQKLLSGLDGIRTILSNSLYREITP